MEVWWYQSPSKCDLVYSLDISNPFRLMWPTRGNFLRDVYAGCLVYAGTDTLTAYISDWLKGTHVSFEVRKARGIL